MKFPLAPQHRQRSSKDKGRASLRSVAGLALMGLMVLVATAVSAPPTWWTTPPSVINATQDQNNYAAVTVGQLKNMAVKAKAEMDIKFSSVGGAGPAIDAMVQGWTTNKSVDNQYAAATVGQVKKVAKSFYDRLLAVGALPAGTPYPWDSTKPVAENYAVANVGQVKHVFNFAIPDLNNGGLDTDGDGMPDAWELANGLDPAKDDSLEDNDKDRVPNLFEYKRGTLVNDPSSRPVAEFIVNPAEANISTEDRIYATIEEAINASQSGHWDETDELWIPAQPYAVIAVKSGVYPEKVYLNQLPVLLLGEVNNGAQTPPVIQGREFQESYEFALNLYNNSVVDGFVIANAPSKTGGGVYAGAPYNYPPLRRRIINCVVRGNECNLGGGILNEGAILDVVHCTVTGNKGTSYGRGISNGYDSTLNLINSIIWGNTGAAAEEIYNFSDYDEGANSIVNTTNSIIAGGEQGGFNIDPQINSGGWLKSNSPAIDRADVVLVSSIDIHGEPRPSGSTPDLGADEFKDRDEDSYSDWAELVAGTDPDDSMSIPSGGGPTGPGGPGGPSGPPADTDMGGKDDITELLAGTNILDPADDISQPVDSNGQWVVGLPRDESCPCMGAPEPPPSLPPYSLPNPGPLPAHGLFVETIDNSVSGDSGGVYSGGCYQEASVRYDPSGGAPRYNWELARWITPVIAVNIPYCYQMGYTSLGHLKAYGFDHPTGTAILNDEEVQELIADDITYVGIGSYLTMSLVSTGTTPMTRSPWHSGASAGFNADFSGVGSGQAKMATGSHAQVRLARGSADDVTEPQTVAYVRTEKENGAVIDTQVIPITIPAGERYSPWVSLAPGLVIDKIHTIDLTPIEIVAHPVLKDGSISSVESDVQLSTPSPVVDVANCALGNVRINADGNLVGDLTVSGSITSAVCDTLPSPRGTIDTAHLYVNGAPNSFADIAVSVSKKEDGPVGGQYPYSGTFNQTIQGVPLVSGNNVFQFTAKDKVYGMPGYHTWITDIRVTEPEDDSGSTTPPPSAFTLAVTLPAATLNAEEADQVTLAYSDGTSTLSGIQLNETSTDSGVFVGTANQQAVQLSLTDVTTLTTTKRDVLTATLLIGGTAAQVKLMESAPASGVFTGGYTSQPLGTTAQQSASGTQAGGAGAGGTPLNPATPSGAPALPTVQADYPTPAEQSNGGESYFYSLELKTPVNFLTTLPEIFVTIEGEKFQVKKDETTSKLLLQRKDGEKPAIFSYRLSERGLDIELNEDHVIDELVKNNASFSAAFLVGLGMGGEDLITGTATLALKPANDTGKLALTAALGIIWGGKTILGQDTEGVKHVISQIGKSRLQEAQQKADTAKALAALAQTAVLSDAELKATILKMLLASAEGGDVGEVADESEVMSKLVMFCAETLPQMWADMGNAPEAKKGYYTGRILFEVASFLVPEAKAGTMTKFTKLKGLTKLMERPFFSKLPAATALVVRNMATKLAETRMCFIAGTKILTKSGLKNIEDVHAGELVWSRDEFTQQEGWMPVVETFTTHPTEIYHLTYSVRGPPEPRQDSTNRMESLGVTAPHPFWVLNREKPCFVAAKELRTGDELALADGGTGEVQAKTLETKVDGGTFTTYNFEVAQFHTYFVGHAGVWVHNSSPAPCERVFSIFKTLLEKHTNDVWTAWGRTSGKIAKLEDAALLRTKLFNEARAKYFNELPNGTPGPWHDVAKQTLRNNKGDSALLGSNMEKTYGTSKPKNMVSHHICEKGDPDLNAVVTRDILNRTGIDIDETANGVWLKRDAMTREYTAQGREEWLEGIGPRHEGPHSPAYSRAVRNRIEPLDGQPADVIRDELQKIAKELIEGTFPWP